MCCEKVDTKDSMDWFAEEVVENQRHSMLNDVIWRHRTYSSGSQCLFNGVAPSACLGHCHRSLSSAEMTLHNNNNHHLLFQTDTAQYDFNT